MKNYEIKIKGIVQGVGFRPFIYKLATSLNLFGYVKNDDEGVSIVVACTEKLVNDFINKIKQNPPPLSKITFIGFKVIKDTNIYKDFKIIQSQNKNNKSTLVSPDISVCDECINDVFSSDNFRFNYALTNCTNCGPRYSIINTVPYDRVNTSMAFFELCEDCKKEYENPLNRRYHAQPLACEKCGPNLSLYDNKKNLISKNINAIKDIASFIKDGKIVAIKGIGGYHLVCDASNEKSINLLRQKKQRPNKPFAVMFKSIEEIKKSLEVNSKEEELLSSIQKPIVILKQKQNNDLLEELSPDSSTIGVFLPYTPLHFLLFKYLDNPIVATSANLSGEPIIIKLDDIFSKLGLIIDYVLDFNRDIVNFCDDSVLSVVNYRGLNIRNSRGYAPSILEFKEKTDKKILALGANQKSNISIAFENSVIVSPYIGDLDSLESIDALNRTIETFTRFYDFKPDLIVCDKHPNYESTKLAIQLANKYGVDLIQVQHHHAHILATMLEFGLNDEVLGICFDGTGFGDDSNLWGGEILKVSRSSFQRVGHINYFKLLGGSVAIKEPKRVAISLLFDNYSLDEVLNMNNSCVKAFKEIEIKILHKVWEKSLNSVLSSSVGRLFDAIASFSNLSHVQSYEGQTGILIEEKYDENIKESYILDFKNEIIDINPMIKQIIESKDNDVEICSKFINSLVNIVYKIASNQNLPVVLSGGVFQNKTLLSLVMKKFDKENIKYYFSSKVPLNDGGISLGQIFYAL